jgi:hypothetical protein
MKFAKLIPVLLLAGLLAAGCSQQTEPTMPGQDTFRVQPPADKDGTETLGPASISIAAGSGIAEGGVGMVGVTSGVINIAVPAGATVKQAILYWAGGTIAAAGDDQISLDGTMVQGTLIGGPTYFFTSIYPYYFSAYRADITGLGLVGPGANAITVADFDFAFSVEDENAGASILVIYDDGSNATIAVRDGLDMAYFGFAPTLDATVPQTFTFAAEATDRVASLAILAGSVGMNRPNQIRVTTSAGDQILDNELGSEDGLLWDSKLFPVVVPAGDTWITVQLISPVSYDPLGASLAWVAAGLSVPETPHQGGCARTIGFWKTHAGFGPQADVVTPLLPIRLGDAGSFKSVNVTTAAMAVSILEMKNYGGAKNGIARLYAQMLGAKLSIASGADSAAIAAAIADADAFLSMYNHLDWAGLSASQQAMVNGLKDMFDDYNNGLIGPGHCD